MDGFSLYQETFSSLSSSQQPPWGLCPVLSFSFSVPSMHQGENNPGLPWGPVLPVDLPSLLSRSLAKARTLSYLFLPIALH